MKKVIIIIKVIKGLQLATKQNMRVIYCQNVQVNPVSIMIGFGIIFKIIINK